jgi:hypothetical protein
LNLNENKYNISNIAYKFLVFNAKEITEKVKIFANEKRKDFKTIMKNV